MKKQFLTSAVCAALAAACAPVALAGEDFQIRYNIAGSLGGEMFAPPDQSGWLGAIAQTRVDIHKITGNDGNALRMATPGGTVALPAPTPSVLYPTYGANTMLVNSTIAMDQSNLALGYISKARFAQGRLAFGINISYASRRQTFEASGASPALNWHPAVPPAVRSAVGTQFDAQYQAGFAQQASAQTGQVNGIGDTELLAGWLYANEQVRILAGASLVIPTGKYGASPGPDIGLGNFYTLRPAVQLAWLPTPHFAVAGKVTAGLNTRNKDNDLRSGNWMGLELAAGYRTPLGVIGLHAVRAQQVQDDGNNPWGPNRFRSSNAGIFFTTLIPAIDTALTLQAMRTTDSRNAIQGDFAQIRLIKVFQ